MVGADFNLDGPLVATFVYILAEFLFLGVDTLNALTRGGEVAAHFQEGLSLDVFKRRKQLNGWEVKWESGLLKRGRAWQGLRVSLPLLLPCESESFDARHYLGKTVHRTLHATSRIPTVTHAQSARPLREPSEGCRLRPLGSAAPAPDLALLVKNVRQRWRFEPGIRVTADPLGREGQDIAVEVAHEHADSHFQLVGVATLFHEDHEHGTQEARTALVHAVILLRVPCLRRQQLRFLQQGVQPTIWQVLG